MEIEPIVGLTYLAIGFVLTYLSLEATWHFTACKIKTTNGNTIKPCLTGCVTSRTGCDY